MPLRLVLNSSISLPLPEGWDYRHVLLPLGKLKFFVEIPFPTTTEPHLQPIVLRTSYQLSNNVKRTVKDQYYKISL